MDPESINAMKNIMMRMNGDTVSEPSIEQITQQPLSDQDTSQHEISEMKILLEKMMHGSAKSIVDDAQSCDELREAITTTVTPSVVTYETGHEIRITHNNGVKRYDVVTASNELVANDLTLFEAANSIVRLLNKGEIPLSNKIRNIIVLEERYYSNKKKTGVFKRRYAEAKAVGNTTKMDIYESKYSVSKGIALQARDELKSL